MKLFVSMALMLFLGMSSASAQTSTQQPTNDRLFAQCLFSITTQAELDQLMVEIYNNHPEVEMVRLDLNTQRALVITTGISSLSEADFTSWFGQYSNSVSCIQIGVYGVDTMNSYPFTNCQ